ncbi:hypothetical protein GIS00_02175 [Nakamurella sp. YIM 132087]|uniref:Right-handed parallel beta-helix repeat-containing protein n=1 Tax=Nakamurella alba TaxID=2665158 RepID=A0A7K1FF54_9ACTN|nr:hypothetical protein [Nakamurella alba]MTD12751.1 hypothetical protein [Nakamurella alba]
MDNTVSPQPAVARRFSRRNVLRLAALGVPVAVGVAVPQIARASRVAAGASGDSTIMLIDPTSRALGDPTTTSAASTAAPTTPATTAAPTTPATTAAPTTPATTAAPTTTKGDAAAIRRALKPGTYKPGASTTGPIEGTSLKQVQGDFTATANGQVIENLEVWGTINIRAYSNVVIRNCVVHGTLATGTDTAFIIFSNDNGRGLLVEDCLLIGRGSPWCSGMRGGNYTIRRTEINNAPDGLCFTSQLGNVTAEGNWIHNGLYMEWDAKTPNMPYAGSYYTHTDGIQFHRGRNYVIRGNTIGGTRYVAAHHSGKAKQLQDDADDNYNSALMIKQEVDSSAANKIENVLIEDNWLAGGQATVNICSGRDNTFSSLTCRDNKFMRSTWGSQMYILRGPGLGNFSGNVFEDDGSAVPFSKGY